MEWEGKVKQLGGLELASKLSPARWTAGRAFETSSSDPTPRIEVYNNVNRDLKTITSIKI